MATINDVNHMTSLGLESNITTATTDKVFYYHRGLDGADASSPILVLIHGYPQSNFMWRHLAAIFPKDIPLFIPDAPGYGRSAALAGGHDKRSSGEAILKSLRSHLSHQEKVPIIIGGHDRGARICHRLAVDGGKSFNFNIKGTIFLDIVPTLIQWKTFATPSLSMASFHWPLLANVEVATAMIKAQGGDVWTRTCINRWLGKSEVGLATFNENNAFDIYCEFMKDDKIIRATCDDYRAGAQEDIQLQEEDQKEGRKIDINALAIYSAEYLGSKYDIGKEWEDWVGKGKLESLGIGDGARHFVAEEAPEKTAAAIVEFYRKHA